MKRYAAVLVALLLIACKDRGAAKDKDKPRVKECGFQPLPPGATAVFRTGGGIKQQFRGYTVFDDGRVEGGKASDVRPGHAPVASVEKLKADIAATGAFKEKDDCWAPPQPVDDGYYTSLVIRGSDNVVHSYSMEDSAKVPPAIERALEIAGKFEFATEPLPKPDGGGKLRE